MSSTKSKTAKTCFIDPATDRVVNYAQFVADLTEPSVGRNRGSDTYSDLCQLISNIVRGCDCGFAEGRLLSTIGYSAPKSSAANEWQPAIRNSNSKIRLTTSGTTGTPKQITHSIGTLTRGVRTDSHHQADVWGLAYPLDRLAGLQVVFQGLLNQNTIVQLRGLPAETIHTAIEKYGVTHLSCTPTFLKLLAAEDQAHPGVQRLTTGGERCDAATMAAIGQLFPHARHRNIYALTEVGNLLITDGDRFVVPAELREKVTVIDGCLAIHRSLLSDPAQDNRNSGDGHAAKPSDPARADWFLTGDLIEVLAETPLSLRFLARRDNLINVGGSKVLPQHVEEQLLELPMIRQAVVYGRKNSVTGQIVVCDVVLEPGHGLDPDIVKQQLALVLPRHAVPRMINVVESLRLTSTGKLCRPSETS